MTAASRLTRRAFLAASGAASIVVLSGCGSSSPGPAPFTPEVDKTTAWRLSTRNVDGASNAAKGHAANKRFASAAVADANRAHPGDKSRVVPIDVSEAMWDVWFGTGQDMVDLRKM